MQKKNKLSGSISGVKSLLVLKKRRSRAIRFFPRTSFLYSRENYNKLRLFSFHINKFQAGKNLVSFLYPRYLLTPARIEPYNLSFVRFRSQYLCYCGRHLTAWLYNRLEDSDPMRYNPLMKIIMDRRPVPRMPRPKSQRFDALSAIFAEFAKPYISYMGRSARVPFRVALNNILELNRSPTNLPKLARKVFRHKSPLLSDDNENEKKFEFLFPKSFIKTRLIWRGLYRFAKQALRDPILGKLDSTREFFRLLFRDYYRTYSGKLKGKCNPRRKKGREFREMFTKLEKHLSFYDHVDSSSYLYSELQGIYSNPFFNKSSRFKSK